jgi:hypothetical protein
MWMNQLNLHHRPVLLSSRQWVSGSERASPGAGTLPGSGMSYEHLRGFLYWDGIFKLLSSPGIDSASLCSPAGRYDNPIPTRFLAPAWIVLKSSTDLCTLDFRIISSHNCKAFFFLSYTRYLFYYLLLPAICCDVKTSLFYCCCENSVNNRVLTRRRLFTECSIIFCEFYIWL